MLRRLSLGLLASAISIASLPAIAQEDGGADEIGVEGISLKDEVKSDFGLKRVLQADYSEIPALVEVFVGLDACPKTFKMKIVHHCR